MLQRDKPAGRGKGTATAGLINPDQKAGMAEITGCRDAVKNGPEFRFQSDGGGVACEGDGAFFQHQAVRAANAASSIRMR